MLVLDKNIKTNALAYLAVKLFGTCAAKIGASITSYDHPKTLGGVYKTFYNNLKIILKAWVA
jgi:hypothetical protein